MPIIMFLVMFAVAPWLGALYLAVVFGRAACQAMHRRANAPRRAKVSAERRGDWAGIISEEVHNVRTHGATVFAGKRNVL